MHDRIKLINAVRLTYFKDQRSHCNNNQHSRSLLKYKYFIFTHKMNHTTTLINAIPACILPINDYKILMLI